MTQTGMADRMEEDFLQRVEQEAGQACGSFSIRQS